MPDEQVAVVPVPVASDVVVLPAQAEVVRPAAAAEPSYAEQMFALLKKATDTLLSSDLPNTREAASEARGVFEDCRDVYSGEVLAFLEFIRDFTCFYEPLVSAMVMQQEGRYSEALEQIRTAMIISEGLARSVDALNHSEDPNVKAEMRAIEPVMRPYPALLGGQAKAIQAEFFGYQGNIEAYIKGMREAAMKYRTANDVRPSANPNFRQLLKLCRDQADRLDARVRNFEPMLNEERYAVTKGDKILIIHGRNEGKWRELEDLLRELGRTVVVIEKMPNDGMTLIEKCIKYSSDCSYAIALFTPDDMVQTGAVSSFQARPNVIFELGWFYGRFGPKCVRIVKQDGTEMPSDLAGVLTFNFTNSIQEIMKALEKELPAAGR